MLFGGIDAAGPVLVRDGAGSVAGKTKISGCIIFSDGWEIDLSKGFSE